MGTRSSIKFIKKHDNQLYPLVNIYQQYDGYVEGVGYELAEFLLDKRIINGIGLDQHNDKYANGFGCLIAQYIKYIKEGVGNVYINDIEDEEKYHYEVIFDNDKYFDIGFDNKDGLSADDLITIKVNSIPNFEGTPSELLQFKEIFDEESE